MRVREPLPSEESRYRLAIRCRDRVALLECLELFPGVLFGGVLNTLSPEEKDWTIDALNEKQRQNLAPVDEFEW